MAGSPVDLVFDNAGWHKATSLNWHHIRPKFLPPCSSDFNPIERLWQKIQIRYMAGFITSCDSVLTNKLVESSNI